MADLDDDDDTSSKPAGFGQRNKPFLQIDSDDNDGDREHLQPPGSRKPGLILDPSSGCSSEQSSAKKAQKSHLTNRKQPSIKLAIDIVSINNQFNYGGEKGELKPEEQESKLESDIMELAGKCVAAMRRAKKMKKPH